jgi:tetratricopeptide (TPR) repeat protein
MPVPLLPQFRFAPRLAGGRCYAAGVSLLAKFLGLFVAATNQTAIVSNVVEETTGVAVAIANPNDPVEQDYQKLLADDDAAQAEADKWIRDNESFKAQGGGIPNEELNRRIQERFKPVRQAYENFLAAHPQHARARIAYGSFLSDTGEEEAGVKQWEKAREFDPKNPAVWNNLANYYGHRSPVTNAFAYYAKAIELNPFQSVYYHNFGTTVYLFRRDAMEYFKLTEPQVFDKALDLYAKALKLDPENFPLATDIAQTYYGIKPLRTDAALGSWTNALNLARDEIEREGVQVHLARIKANAGRFDEARAHLDAVTNAMYADLKKRVLRNLVEKEKMPLETNASPAKLMNMGRK